MDKEYNILNKETGQHIYQDNFRTSWAVLECFALQYPKMTVREFCVIYMIVEV